MSYRSSRPARRPPREGRGCLGTLVLFVVFLLLLAAAYGLLARPAISAYIGERAAEQLGGAPASGVEGQIVEQAGEALPGAVAALPPGEIVVTEQDANSFIAANPGSLGPLDQAQVRFTGGRANADVGAYGMSGVASAGLAAQNGQIVVVDAQIDGALGLVLSGQELANALAQRLNAELAAQGRSVSDVRVEEGRLIFITSGG
jgi:hypothetical protein